MPFVSLIRMMECLARDYPNKLALVCEDRRLTYGELNDRINRLAQALLDIGIQKGDKVAVLNSNGVEMIESIYAVLKTGGVLVLLNSMVKGESLRLMLNDSDSVALICGEAFTREIDALKPGLPKIRPDSYLCTGSAEIPGYISYSHIMKTYSGENPGIPIFPEDLFNIIYSSGTTGLPKGIVHSHDHRCLFVWSYLKEFIIHFESVICNSTPLYHNGSWVFVLPALFAGATVVIMKKFHHKGFLELVEKEKVTHAYLVPTQYIALMELPEFHSYNTSSLEVLLSLAAPLSRKTKEDILTNFHCRFFEMYGVTEGFSTILKPMDQRRKPGSVGKATLGSELRVVDENMKDVPVGEVGEIVGRGTLKAMGYYKKPELTAQTIVDGWLRTGDLGRLDEEGYLYLVGRKKDMIISGGVNIYPEDIEEVMMHHPKILEVSVFGVPHEKWGETPRAAVVLKEGQEATQEEILEWTNFRLARYQKISGVDFMKELPRNPAGKVLKRELRAPYWKGLEREI